MNEHNKTLLTVIGEAVIEPELTRLIRNAGVTGYTISDVRGSGHRGERSGDLEQTGNIKLEIICDAKTAAEVARKIHEKLFENFAVVLFTSEIAVLRSEKFR